MKSNYGIGWTDSTEALRWVNTTDEGLAMLVAGLLQERKGTRKIRVVLTTADAGSRTASTIYSWTA